MPAGSPPSRLARRPEGWLPGMRIAYVIPAFPPAPDQERDRRAAAVFYGASCEWLDMGQGVAELRTRQDVLLPMLPAQEILP